MWQFFKWLFRSILILIGLIFLYLSSHFILSSIPASNHKGSNTGDVAIYIRTDDFHTEVIVPSKSEWKDWTSQILFNQSCDFYAFGWGDRGFYLQTAEAKDFQLLTAFRAVFYLGTSVVHITHYKNLAENEQCKKLWLTKEQYLHLNEFIEASFAKNKGQYIPILDHSYGQSHLFFESKGSYNLFYTCNTWVNQALKRAEQPTCIWTPFASGIMYHLRDQ